MSLKLLSAEGQSLILAGSLISITLYPLTLSLANKLGAKFTPD